MTRPSWSRTRRTPCAPSRQRSEPLRRHRAGPRPSARAGVGEQEARDRPRVTDEIARAHTERDRVSQRTINGATRPAQFPRQRPERLGGGVQRADQHARRPDLLLCRDAVRRAARRGPEVLGEVDCRAQLRGPTLRAVRGRRDRSCGAVHTVEIARDDVGRTRVGGHINLSMRRRLSWSTASNVSRVAATSPASWSSAVPMSASSAPTCSASPAAAAALSARPAVEVKADAAEASSLMLSLIHISEPTRPY